MTELVKKRSRSKESATRRHHTSKDQVVYGLGTKKGSGGHHHHGSSHRRHRRSSRRRRVLWTVLSVLLLVSAAGGLAAYKLKGEAKEAKATALEMKGTLAQAKTHMADYDFAGLYDDMQVLAEQGSTLEKQTSGPIWTVASAVPGLGNDFKNVRAVSRASAHVPASALPVLGLLSGKGDYGELTTSGLLKNCGKLSLELDAAVGQMSDLKHGFVDQLNDVVDLCKETLPDAAAVMHMFGTDGQSRRYLILGQQNTEIRSTGGFFGSWGSMQIANGDLEVYSFYSRAHVEFSQKDVAELFSVDEQEFLGTRIMGLNTSINIVPDFSHVGKIAANYWRITDNEFVDGTIAVDPVFIQHLLGLLGSITTKDGVEVTSENAAQLVLHEAYRMYEKNADQDEFFAQVAHGTIDKLMDNLGTVDMGELIDLLKKDGKAGRVLVWMKNADEERVIKDFGLGGEVPNDPATPQVGVYLTDYGWSKMGWYLDLRSSMSDPVANDDGSKTYQVTTTIHNVMDPNDYATEMPYVLTHNLKQASSDSAILDLVLLVGPEGGSLTDLAVNGSPVSTEYDTKWDQNSYGKLYGKDAWQVIVDVPMQETATLTYTVTTSPEATEPLVIHQTPTARIFD